MRLRGLFQVTGSWLFTLAFGLSASALTLFTLGRFSHRLSPWLLRFWGRSMLRIAGVTWELQGGAQLEDGATKIVTFNHASLLDAFLVTAVMPAGGVAALKREVLWYPVVGVTVVLLGFLLLDRANRAQAHGTLGRAGRRMAAERLSVFIAPEGTRSLDGSLQPFKKGALRLALDSRAPIVPMVIEGAFALHGPGRLVSSRGHVVIRVLAPRPSTGLTEECLAVEGEALRAVYAAELLRMGEARTR